MSYESAPNGHAPNGCWTKRQPISVRSDRGGRAAGQTRRHDGAARDSLCRREDNKVGDKKCERCDGLRITRRHRRGKGRERAHLRAVMPLRGRAGTCQIRLAGHVHPRHAALGLGPVSHGGNGRISAAQDKAARRGHESHWDQRAAKHRGEQQCCKPPPIQPSSGHLVSHVTSLAQGSPATHRLLRSSYLWRQRAAALWRYP